MKKKKQTKKRKNKKLSALELTGFGIITCCVILLFGVIGYAVYDIFIDDGDYYDPEIIEVVVAEVEYVEPEPVVYPNLTYDPQEVLAEVNELIEDHFNIGDTIADFQFPRDMDWLSSYYSDDGGHVVVVGTNGIEDDKEMFRMVLIHEYCHYALHRLELEDGDWHEAITDAFTWVMATDASKRAWGAQNQDRSWPYNVISTKLISEGNDDCLEDVFSKDNKIDSIKEIIDKLEEDCDYDIVSLINQL